MQAIIRVLEFPPKESFKILVRERKVKTNFKSDLHQLPILKDLSQEIASATTSC